MLLSTLLALAPAAPTRVEGFHGRYVQAWLLGLISRREPDLAAMLHSESGPRPYTVSGLWLANGAERRGEGRTLAPGDVAFVRLTSLTRSLSMILGDWIGTDLSSETLCLGDTVWKVVGAVDAGGWSGQTTFGDLVREAASQRDGPAVTLEFASPTAFRSEGQDLILPTPDQVWRSLYWRWNTFAPSDLQIDPNWPYFAAAAIRVDQYRLHSERIVFRHGDKGIVTGCVGWASYRLLPPDKCGEFEPLYPGAVDMLRTLAAFALYSGVGHHTTIGLGQTRWQPTDGEPSKLRRRRSTIWG